MKSQIALWRLWLVAGALLVVTGARAGEVVASFKEDFQGETPKTGWQYQWNADTVDDTATYSNLSFQSEQRAYVIDPNAGGSGAPTGPYIKKDFAHPGAESSSGGKNCIYTYTLQAGQGGKISIADSRITRVDQANPGDIEVRIRVNDTVSDPVPFETKGSFDRELGTLKDGDVISVLVGPGASANFDMYQIDFSLIKE